MREVSYADNAWSNNSVSDINPKGLVPAIEYKGKALYESLIICEFFEEAYSSHTPHLLPADPFTRAYARIWIDYVAKSFLPPFFRLLQSQEVEKQDAAREEVYKALRTFAKEIKGPYFLGNEFSLVDIAIAPWIVRDHIVTEHRKFKRAEVSEVWDKYATLVTKRDSLIKTTSVSLSFFCFALIIETDRCFQNKEHYEEIYGRYLRDEAQSEAAKATRSGNVIPWMQEEMSLVFYCSSNASFRSTAHTKIE